MVCIYFSFVILILYNIIYLKTHVHNIHFYLARGKRGNFELFMGKEPPYRGIECWENSCRMCHFVASVDSDIEEFGINLKKYESSLNWEDEPIEVYVSV